MIDERTMQWLRGLTPESGVQSVLVQLAQLPVAEILQLKTRKERIALTTRCIEQALAPIVAGGGVARDAVQVLGALGQAIIQATPDKLKELIRTGSLLDKSEQLKVLPNSLMPGLGGVQ